MVLAVDIGGTKTLVATLNKEGDITRTEKFETPKIYTDFLIKLEETVKKFTTHYSVCVAALPGHINRQAGVGMAFGNLPWEDVHFTSDVSNFIKCPVYIENDAKLAGLAEANSVLSTYRKVLYLTVSTGIGGGLIVDGKIDSETADAEIGHILLEHDGKLQRWEDFASGRAIVAKFGKRASEITDPSDWYIIARNIALGLINAVASYTPDCVIIGGGVGAHLEKFQDKLVEQLRIYDDELLNIPVILKAQHAEEAVIYGCYTYANQL